MDEPSKHDSNLTAALRLTGHSFSTAFFLALLAGLATFALSNWLQFIFGTGVFAYGVVILFLFLFFIIFKKFIFNEIYRDYNSDSDAALLEYLQHSAGGNAEEEASTELLENALHLKQVRAHDCMSPRPEIVHVSAEAPVEVLRDRFVESRLSRILITDDGDIDRVLGYVHVQQMFLNPTDIRSMVMPVLFVPETIPIDDLLYKFIRQRTGIAGVVDEYGAIAGLVTMQDALEQLFGKIDDEHDEEEFIEMQVGPQEFRFSGRLEIEYLNEKYPGLGLPEGTYNTLSGYLVTSLHTIPGQGAELELDGKKFVLELVSDRKIETVRVVMP